MKFVGKDREVVDAGSAIILAVDPDLRIRAMHQNFVRGRWLAPDGSLRLASSPPPGWRIPECYGNPADPFGEAALADQLAEVSNRLPGRIQLRFSISRRRLIGCSAEQHPIDREEWVWSLAGSATLKNGAVVPLGRSGPGGRLVDAFSGASEMDWLCRAVVKAEGLPPGIKPAVLAPQAAAVLVHESIGHFAEAPTNGCSPLFRLGSQIASTMVTVDDIPDMVGGMASYRIDDDGIEVLGPTPVVREGMLVGMLHSWESAIAAQTLPSANSRSASAWASPIPRMSNLCCYPGTTTIDALIAQISDGLYIHHLAEGFGIGDVIEARVVLAERVANGQLTNQFLTGGVVRERAGLLQRVIGLGDSISANPNAMCGKAGQLLADVGTWAPAMALSELRIDS